MMWRRAFMMRMRASGHIRCGLLAMALFFPLSPRLFAQSSSPVSLSVETGIRYNRLGAHMESHGDEEGLQVSFDQLQILQETAVGYEIFKPLSLCLRLSFAHDIASANALFDAVRSRNLAMVKIGPEVEVGELFTFDADFLAGISQFSDNLNRFLVLGAAFGVGVKVFEAAGGKVAGHVKAVFEYRRGSYADEFSAGVAFSAVLR